MAGIAAGVDSPRVGDSGVGERGGWELGVGESGAESGTAAVDSAPGVMVEG
ncbi:hypothetical protein AB0Y14_05885 [Rothia sp. HC945]|uniref:hypothetical protein n=1 Tax=Rothia sp. HC945 TaxID=3171170 RepID=UPI003F1F6621